MSDVDKKLSEAQGQMMTKKVADGNHCTQIKLDEREHSAVEQTTEKKDERKKDKGQILPWHHVSLRRWHCQLRGKSDKLEPSNDLASPGDLGLLDEKRICTTTQKRRGFGNLHDAGLLGRLALARCKTGAEVALPLTRALLGSQRRTC